MHVNMCTTIVMLEYAYSTIIERTALSTYLTRTVIVEDVRRSI